MGSRRLIARRIAVALALGAALAPATQAAPEPLAPQVLRLAGTLDGVAVVADRPVQFLDASSGEIDSWAWDFSYEPGITAVDSLEQNPLWTFGEAGPWSIRLEVCNPGGCSAAVKQIQVVEPCTLLPDLVVGPLAEAVIDDQVYEACHTVSAGGLAVIGPAGSATFRAGRSVAFGDGFSIGGGGRLRVEIDPLLDVQ